MTTNETRRLRYSVPEAATILNVSTRGLWRRVYADEIETVRDGRLVLIHIDEIERYAKHGPLVVTGSATGDVA